MIRYLGCLAILVLAGSVRADEEHFERHVRPLLIERCHKCHAGTEAKGAINDSTGRDHHVSGYTIFMAGGGFKGGITYGETDEFGTNAISNPTTVHDLHATILHQMGLDHERLTYRYGGRDHRLTDVHGKVIREVLA